MIEKYQFTIVYESSVETSTGEIIETKILKTSEKKKVISKTSKEEVEEDFEVKLDSNKLILSKKVIGMLGAKVGDRIDIRYKQKGSIVLPIIARSEEFGEPDAGNKLTKTNTVSFRGKNNAKLAEQGSTFKLEAELPNKFWLIGDKAPEGKEIDIESELDIESLNNFQLNDDLTTDEEIIDFTF